MVALETAFPTLLLATHRYAPLSVLLTFLIVSCSLSADKRIRASSFGFIEDPFFVHDIVEELPVALQKRVKFSPSLTGSAFGCVSIAGVTVEMQTSIFYLKSLPYILYISYPNSLHRCSRAGSHAHN